jgi:hypothetical protein
VFDEVDQEALALLLAAKEHHDRLEQAEPLSEGTRVAPVLVADCVGWGLRKPSLRAPHTTFPSSSGARTDNISVIRVCATLGEESEVELGLV